MKVIDLFAGVGGLSLGFVQEGFEVVYANEYDKSIAAAFKFNHPSADVDTRDIQDIDIKKSFGKYKNKVDAVVGGPPCQGFSQKGSRIGFDDPRNFLFLKFVEVVAVVQPNFILLENVPGILSTYNGYFKSEIVKLFSKLGYDLDADVLHAENFGVPQTRRRAVFLGQKGTLKVNLPRGNGLKTTIYEAISDLPRLQSGEGEEFAPYSVSPISNYQRLMRAGSEGIWNHVATKHSKLALERISLVPPNGSKKDLPSHHQTKSIYSGTWGRINPNGFARTITTRFDTPSSGQFTLPDQDRCLTVREAARIQSFPDNFVFLGTKSSQMLQVGNAVPPLIARAIAREIRDYSDSGALEVTGKQIFLGEKQLPVSP